MYFLKDNLDSLVVAFSRSLKFPERVRSRLLESVLSAYETQKDGKSYDSNQDLHISASSISIDDLMKDGWGYVFDFSQQVKEQNGELTDFIYELIHSVSLQLWNNKYKGVQKGPFYFWLSQEDEGQFTLYIAPFYNLRVSRTKKPFDPVYLYMYQRPGFLQAVQGNPILENSIPLAQYANGQLARIDLDAPFLITALEIQKVNKKDDNSLYQNLLDEA